MNADSTQTKILRDNAKRVPNNQPFNVKPVPNKKKNSVWKHNAK